MSAYGIRWICSSRRSRVSGRRLESRDSSRRTDSSSLAETVGEALAKAPDFRAVVLRGLSALDELAGRRGTAAFADLAKPQRTEALNELVAGEPGFLPGLIFHTYIGYYEDGRVMEALGLEARPPHPLGYHVEPMDTSLVDRVRQRPKLYR